MSERRATMSALFTWRSSLIADECPLSPTQRHVAFALSMYMNEAGGSCFPGQDKLAKATGYSERAVRDALKALESAGYVSIRRERLPSGRWAVCHYEATVPGRTFHDSEAPPEGSAAGPPEPRSNEPPEGGSADYVSKSTTPTLTTPKTVRRRDPVWDALVEVFGEPSTKTERTLLGKVASELRDADATGEQIIERAREAWRRWDRRPFSPAALVKHWSSLAVKASSNGRGSSIVEGVRRIQEVKRDAGRVAADRGEARRAVPRLPG